MSEQPYLDLLREVYETGAYREGRNGGTYGLFGRQIRFDLAHGFPLLTTKKVNFHALITELIWFLRGDTNIQFLHDHGVHIWDEWADGNGELGPIYGRQWRLWDAGHGAAIDQIGNVIDGLKRDPYGRRHIVTAWNPVDLPEMALPPCHCLFQFFVANGRLSCQLYQRSADIFLGVPFNIASYAALTHIVARETGLKVGEFVHTFGDVHLYENHSVQAELQLSRDPRPLPKFWMSEGKALFALMPDDFAVVGYEPHDYIPAPVSV